jgi:hypothetical protein
MADLQQGDRVFHVGVLDERGTVVHVDKVHGEVTVAWDDQFHATETHPIEMLRMTS